MRILVAGGTGFFGSRIASCLSILENVSVEVSGRQARPGVVGLDLGDPSTFKNAAPYKLIVNCTDTIAAPPDAFLAWCLTQGKVALEATSDTETIERLIETFRVGSQGSGTLILGAGVFTGLSNVVGGTLAARAGGCHTLELAIRFTPFSAGGKGLCALMAKLLGSDAVYFSNGVRHTDHPVTDGVPFEFEDGKVETMKVGFAEAPMLRASTGCPNINTYFAGPGWMRRMALFFKPLSPRWLLRAKLVRWWMNVVFLFARRILFRSYFSPVELMATAQRRPRPGRDASVKTLAVRMPNGMEAGGHTITAFVALLQKQTEYSVGVLLPDEIFSLPEVLHEIRARFGESAIQVTHGADLLDA